MDGSSRTPSLDELLGQERWLHALARRLVRDAATADDLVQETWFRALRARGEGEHTSASIGDARSWLTRVLRNVWRERGRSERARGRREARVAPTEALPSARESVERIELQQRLASLVLELDEPYRSIVIWRYYEGRTAADVAAELGEPASRVRWRLMRARELLRARLDRERRDWTGRYALFLPLARRAPAPAAVAGAAGVAGLGAFFMAGKSLLWVGAAALLAWTLVQFRGSARNEPLSSSDPSHVMAEAEPAPELAGAPSLGAVRSEVPPSEPEAPPAASVESAPAADGSARLRGGVRAAEGGQALEGAEVALFGRGGGKLEKSARTDAAGVFVLEEVEPGRYDVACRIEGRLPRRVREVELSVGNETRLDIELERGFLAVVEVAERASGAPIAAAEVQLIAGDRDTVVWFSKDVLPFHSLSGVTSLAGSVELGGAARGAYQYVVQAAGYATAHGETLLEEGGAPLRVALDRGGVVYGTVLRADGSPAAGARVFLNPMRYVKGHDDHAIRQNGVAADAAGRYRLEGVPENVYHAVALLPDGSGVFHVDPEQASARQLAPVLVGDSTEVPLDFRLPAPGRVHGRVLDASGQPIPDARVSVSWGDFKPDDAGFFPISLVEGMKESIHHTTRSDGEGRFEIEGLRISYEPLELRVGATGYVEVEVELDVSPGALLEPVITLQGLGATITGRLSGPDGAPIANQTVGVFETEGERLLDFFQAQSAADGSYELKVPLDSAGTRRHRVFPILRDTDPLVSEPEKREGVATGASGVDFVLRAKRRLRGSVADDTGATVRDFLVHGLVREPGAEDRWDALDANRGEGRFDLYLGSGSLPGSLVELRFSAPGCDPASIAIQGSGADLDADEHRIVLRRAGDLHGVVLDQEGRAVSGAVVALATLDSAIYPKGTGFAPRDTTDAEGRFRLRGVPEAFVGADAPPAAATGHLLVCPRRDDAPPLLHFPLPEQRGVPLELVLPRSLAVELVFRHASGSPVEGGVLVIDPEGWPMEPAFETHLADQESATRGVLSEGRTRFRLRPGAHHAVLVLGVEAAGAFPFEVSGDGDETAIQERSFTVPDPK